MHSLALILQDSPAVPIAWQTFLIAHFGVICAVIFWAGILTNRLNRLQRDRDKDEEQNGRAHEKLARQIAEHSQVVPVAEMAVKLDGILDRLERLGSDFDDFRNSIFVQAIQEAGAQPRRPGSPGRGPV